MGVILAATDTLNWLSSITGQSPTELTATLDPADASPVDVIFLPYLSGERTPHSNADARGAFVKLGHSTDVQKMTRAVLQGVSYAFRDNQQALREAGTELQDAFVIGGGSRSDYWVQLLANILDMPLQLSVDGDFGAGLGAARLGMIASDQSDPLEICPGTGGRPLRRTGGQMARRVRRRPCTVSGCICCNAGSYRRLMTIRRWQHAILFGCQVRQCNVRKR